MIQRYLSRALMSLDRQSRVPRMAANRELARIGPLFSGEVCNVFAWKDEDKEGRHYRDYFPHAASYMLSNFRSDRGLQAGELELDLEQPLPADLHSRFDVVFNHTTLEHIYDVHLALKNLCLLTRDIVIVVVPFMQMVHYTDTYGDYWRFTPLALRRMFADNGLTVVHEFFTDVPRAAVYLITVASRHPDRWRDKFPPLPANNMIMGARAIPSPFVRLLNLARRFGLVK